jgi:single-stranded-DNA-specific exonuclease
VPGGGRGQLDAVTEDEEAHLSRARLALRNAVAVVPHTDADGLAAGAIALRDRGESADAAVLLARGQTPFAQPPPPALPDGALAVLDWGVRPLDRPALLVDHHLPEAAPRADQVVVSSYGCRPETPTAPLMRRIVPAAPAWLAAVGAAGDLGRTGLDLPECAGVPVTAVSRLAGLVNAPRRLPDGPVRTALALLVEHDDPRDALADPRAGTLEEAKRAWRAEFDRVVRTAPRVGERAALLRFSSPVQVHPVVAQTWARRLAPRMVVAANDGYLPGKVNFAVRGGHESLPQVLRAALPGAGGEFAHGHDRASGGSLDPASFERLMDALGLAGAATDARGRPAAHAGVTTSRSA